MFNDSKPSSARGWGAGKIRNWVFLFLVLATVVAIRIRLLDVPLERDEGEYAYAGQLLLQGVSPYQGAYNVTIKLPGTCAAYALIMALFGQTAAALHAGVLLVNLATAMLVFVLARRIYGEAGGVIAAGVCALLSIVPATLGLAAHATHFVMLPALAGVLLLQNLNERTLAARIFLAGLFLGLATLMKQTGAVFGLFAAGWIISREISSGQKQWGRLVLRLVWLALGGVLPFVLMCGAIALTGDFGQFWLWTFKYAGSHASIITFGQSLRTMTAVVTTLFRAAPGLWCFAVLGIFLISCESELRRWRGFVIGFAVFSAAAAWPGWRAHYYIQLLPAAGLLAAATYHWISGFLARRAPVFPTAALPALVFAVAGLSVLIQRCDIYFRQTPAEVSRTLYGTNPFPESVEIARYLADHTLPAARIAVLGSEPQIYFYSHRRSATGYICTYPLMEAQPYAGEMQQEMIRQIEQANPEYVVFVHVSNSWLQYADSNPSIFQWFGRYQREQLQLVGLVEIRPGEPTRYRWFDQPPTDLQTTAESWLSLFKHRVDNEPVPLKAN